VNADRTPDRLTHHRCQLGEGPHYDPDARSAWWFDILGKTLYEFDFASGETQVHVLPRMASVIARIDGDRQLIAMEDGLYVRNRRDGALALRHALEADQPRTRSNDGRVHPSGTLWIGTMGKQAEKGAGTIYHYDGETLLPLFPNISVPNSICFSPDGQVGYFADTAVNTVWRVDLDPVSGKPTGEPAVFLSESDLPLGGSFDGSVTDVDGVLWNAAWGGGSVSGFAPNGELVGMHEVPAMQATCPCFVGDRLDALLVTTAWEGYSEAQRRLDPGAGFTYLIRSAFHGTLDQPFVLN